MQLPSLLGAPCIISPSCTCAARAIVLVCVCACLGVKDQREYMTVREEKVLFSQGKLIPSN